MWVAVIHEDMRGSQEKGLDVGSTFANAREFWYLFF